MNELHKNGLLLKNGMILAVGNRFIGFDITHEKLVEVALAMNLDVANWCKIVEMTSDDITIEISATGPTITVKVPLKNVLTVMGAS